MQDQQPSDHVEIAIFDPATGQVRQKTICLRRDALLQVRAWPGCEAEDVTGQVADFHPRKHMVHLKTRRLIARIQPLSEAKDEKLTELLLACHRAEAGGFTSSASGRALVYASGDQHHGQIQARIHGGGDLSLHDGRRLAHTPEQVRAVMADAVAQQDRHRRALQVLREKVEQAHNINELETIQWR